MSTRRSTRNSSAEPVALGATPGRRKNFKATGLGPAPVGQIPIPAKESTSYGGSHVPIGPTSISKLTAANNLQKTLTKVKAAKKAAAAVAEDTGTDTETDPEESEDEPDETPVPAPTRGRGGLGNRGRGNGRIQNGTNTPGGIPNSSFSEESRLAGIAAFGDDTPVDQSQGSGRQLHSRPSSKSNGLTSIVEEAPRPDSFWPAAIEGQWEELHRMALEQRRIRKGQVTAVHERIALWFHNILDYARLIWNQFGLRALWEVPCRMCTTFLQTIAAHPVLFFLIAAILSASIIPIVSEDSQFSNSISNLRYDVSHTIRRYVGNPIEVFSPGEYSTIDSRLSNLEHEFRKLTQQRKLDSGAIKKLQSSLPSSVLLSTDSSGNPVIDQDFWRALLGKMKDEGLTSPGSWRRGKDGSNTGDVEIIGQQTFNDWIKKNEEKMKMWHGSAVDDAWDAFVSKGMQSKLLVTREDVISMIAKSFEESRREIRTEQQKLSKQFQDDVTSRLAHPPKQHSGSHEQRAIGFTKDEVKAIATEALNRIIPTSQLAALAKVRLRQNVADAMQRVNFFSPGSGVVANPLLSSTTFEFYKARGWWIKRTAQWMLGHPGPVPNSHMTAFTRWEEQGDCWCAAKSPSGAIDLAAILEQPIYPDEIIVEHIHPSATLNPNSTPRKLEVIAQLDDFNAIQAVDDMARRLFPDRAAEEKLDESWVVVGQFYYDLETAGAQSFKLDIDLKGFKAPTRQILVRVLDNAGSPYTCIYRLKLHGDVA